MYISEELKEQALKYLALGTHADLIGEYFNIEKSKILNLKNNNKELYKMYEDFFTIKAEIKNLNLTYLREFILNLLSKHVKIKGNEIYFRGKKVDEPLSLLNKAEEVLERENINPILFMVEKARYEK